MEIVAEISGNHGGSIENAYRLIRAASKAGADAVKFQCFDPARLAARRAKRADVLALAGGVPLIDLYRKIWTPIEWFPSLIHVAGEFALDWFSSVFDPIDVELLESLGCPRYKIAAFETGKPIIMSVRPRPDVTILNATDYEGAFVPLGVSAHGAIVPPPATPMVEYHIKLDDVSTPDDAFSLNPERFEEMVREIRGK